MIYLQLLAGLVLLFGGAEFLVRGAVAVATKMGLSAMLIGMTVVGFGTSTPEFVVSLNAAFDGSPGIAMGNVVGSNIANIWLILGAAALVAPVMVNTRAVIRDAVMLMGTTVLFALLCLFGTIEQIAGGILVLALIGYFLWAYLQERADGAAAHLHEREAEEFQDVPMNTGVAWASVLGGLVALIYGADLLVGAGTVLARDAGVSEEVIGLTLIAVGTSLPELAASVMAAWRGHADVAIGNIVGSNIFNILGVAGGVAALATLPVPEQIAGFDLWVMVAAAFMLLAYLALSARLRRRDGILFVGIYCAYLAVQIMGVDRFMAWFV